MPFPEWLWSLEQTGEHDGFELLSLPPALKWQSEPPTEPVEQCLVREPDGSGGWKEVFIIEVVAGSGETRWTYPGKSASIAFRLIDEGAQYCPLPAIGEG